MDIYKSFEQLRSKEKKRKDYRIVFKDRKSRVIFVAPHGGGIEKGTSEITRALAGKDFSYYIFEGLKQKGNKKLHITSSFFDEPHALRLVAKHNIVVTVHGYGWDTVGECVMVGGLHKKLIRNIEKSLRDLSYDVRPRVKMYDGTNPKNICNKGKFKKGIQLELNLVTRKALVFDKNKMKVFVGAVMYVLSSL